MLAGDLGRRTGRSQSYPRSSLGVPRQVLTHGTLKLTFRGGQFFGTHPSPSARERRGVHELPGSYCEAAASYDRGVRMNRDE